MNVQVFNVLEKGPANYPTGRDFLINLSEVTNAVEKTPTTTSFASNQDKQSALRQETWVVNDAIAVVNSLISGVYNVDANISLTPNSINGKANTVVHVINANDIKLGVGQGANILVLVLQEGRLDLEKWVFNATTLAAFSTLVNAATSLPYKVYTALVNQISIVTASGVLVVGKTYEITAFSAGDDFVNVGGVNSAGSIFVATGTTPTVWTNGSSVLNQTDSAPTAVVLENTLGAVITYQYSSNGIYFATSDINLFLSPNEHVTITGSFNIGGGLNTILTVPIFFNVAVIASLDQNSVFTDGIVGASVPSVFEIRIYN